MKSGYTLVLFALAIGVVTSRATAPSWWAARGVANGNAANDYAAANLGQLKNMAIQATAEMDAVLVGGAGSSVHALVDPWLSAPGSGVTRNDYAAINLGQLKAVAKVFYDRLQVVGYTGAPLSGGTYPWGGTAKDYAVANIGQLKYVFSFTLSLSSPVDPATISGLRLLLRADLGVTADGSGKISIWADQSGNSNNATQSTGTAQPLLVTNAVNGQPVVRFDGTTTYLQLPNIMGSATAGEVYMVLRSTGASGHYSGFWKMGGGNGSYYPTSGGSLVDSFGSTVQYSGAISGIPDPSSGVVLGEPLSQYNVYNISAQSGSWASWMNARLYLAEASNTVAFNTTPNLGNAASDYFAGDLAELIVYNRTLTATERAGVSAYLLQRFGLSLDDSSGLSEAWEQTYFGQTGLSGLSSPNGSGETLLQSFENGHNPYDSFQGRAFALNPGAGTGGANPSVAYTYDASGRIMGASYSTGNYNKFTFDAASNLTNFASATGAIVAWRTAHSLPADGSGIGADDYVVSGDGLPNLAKYAFGLDPAVAYAADQPVISLTTVGANKYLTLTYQRPSSAPADLTYAVEVSADRSAWTSASGATVAISTTTVGGITTVVVRDATPITSLINFGRYIRLNLTRAALP